MPYKTIAAAKAARFPTSAEGIALTLSQINKLAEIYDAIKKAGTAKNPFSVAWTEWKKLYKKTDDAWVEIKTAAVQFGTEPFVAATGKAEGIPDHAAMIEGRLIHLDTKNLKGWGVTTAAAEQIIAGISGIPIRACNSHDPHACDFAADNLANVGYATGARVEDDWIVASAAITDQDAAHKINDGTWMPFWKGGWSVTGFPSNPTHDFKTGGLLNGFNPASIALVLEGSAKPAFEGSGFGMVAAAITNHRGDDMTEKNEGGGNDPVTYTQDALDKAVKDALETQKTEFDADAKKIVDAELAKQKTGAAEILAKQKIEYDEAIAKLSADDKAAFDARLAEMTPTADVEKMISAAVAQGQTDTIEAIEREKLAAEYQGLLTASIVGAPFRTDGAIDPAKIDAKMTEVRGMKSAAIAGMINEAKLLVAAATPGSTFDSMEIPGQPPGAATQEAQDMAACDRMLGAV